MRSERILLLDIGNTSVTMGLGCGMRVSRVNRLPTGQCTTERLRSALADVAGKRMVTGACIGSVVPAVTPLSVNAVEKGFGVTPILLTNRLNIGVGIDYPEPATIGADRLANAAGAVKKFGSPVVVADFGTALTFDIVSDAPAYIGGVIVPGLPFMTDYLAERTALLPHISLRGGYGAVGRSTESAMRIGAKLGYRGMVREIVKHIEVEAGMHGATLCATGGYAGWVLKGLDIPIRIEPSLTLFGLQVVYHLNSR